MRSTASRRRSPVWRPTAVGIVLLLLAGGGMARAPAAADRPVWLRVQVGEMPRDTRTLAAAGYDIAGIDLDARTVDIVGTTADAARLAAGGYGVTVVRYLDGEALEVNAAYLDPDEMNALMDSLEAMHPGLARVVDLGVTEEGRSYRVMKISDNVMVEEDEPAVFFDFEHHAREVMTPEVAADIMEYLLTRYAGDPQVAAWVDSTEIWVIPNHNPDGLHHVFTGADAWRKNRRNNGDGTFGVDPNRNYAFQWGACNGSSSVTSSELYRGPSAESEPETRALAGLARDQRPVFDLTYHSFGELVLYPYGCARQLPSDQVASEDVGQRLARTLVRDSGVGTYTAGYSWSRLNSLDGESKSWFLGELGTFSYTVEINSTSSGGFAPSYAVWRDSTVQRNRAGWQFILDRLSGPSIRGHVTDACTDVPLEATVSLEELPLMTVEVPRAAEPLHGRFQRIVSLGDYNLRVSHSGYHDQVHPVAVRTSAVDRDVALVPDGSHGILAASMTVDDTATGDGDGRLDPGETAWLRVTARASGEAVTGITAEIIIVDAFVTVTDSQATYPDLAAGEEAAPSDDGFLVTADPATPGDHVAEGFLTFFATETLCQESHFVDLPVTPRRAGCPFQEPMDADPGWAIANSHATGWAFGPPTALASGRGPGSGATGVNVYGTNLTGFYGSNANHVLTTSPFDLSGLTGATLELQRWLSSEEGFDYATVEASADGATWEFLWTGTSTDRDWELLKVDASAVDGQPSVRFRFTLQSDSSIQDGGFYLDDVAVCGEIAPAMTVLSLAVADDTANTACTDGDGIADAGEIVSLRLTAENRGVAAALGATARVVSSDPAVEVLSGRLPLGDVAAGAQAQADFSVRIDSAASCAQVVTLSTDFSSNGGVPFAGAASALTLEMDGGSCDANPCATACAPAAQIAGLGVDATGRVAWAPSTDPCHAVAGIGYRVYRAVSPAPLVNPPPAFPDDTGFVEVSLTDVDGSLLDAGFDDLEVPPPGTVLYYLAADVGTDGSPGPVGHYGN